MLLPIKYTSYTTINKPSAGLATETLICYHSLSRNDPSALVVKGLSRLPVTEEIAGSNPVERAKENTYPWGRYFLWHVSGCATRIADSRSAAR